MMRITLNEPGSDTLLELEINKVDTPAGTGWSVITPKGRKVLIRCCKGEWQTEGDSNISHEFWQTVGNEITRFLGMERQAQNSIKTFKSSAPRSKRPRIWLDF